MGKGDCNMHSTNNVCNSDITILVTGACGFIGSNITNYLYKKKYNVVPLDNCYLGKPSNLYPKLLDKLFTYDISNDREMKLLSRYGFDYIINLAARSSTPMFYGDPRESFNINVRGFQNVLNLAKESSCNTKIIYVSTSSLYSSGEGFTEDLCVRPGSYYEYSKFCNEIDAKLYYQFYGIRSVGLRFFSIYGYNELHKQKYANLVSQFLWDMEKGNPPVIYGDGTQTRDFTWVEDVCKSVELILKNDWYARIVNIGTGISHSLNDLVDIINEELGTDIKPKYIKNPIKNYVQDTKADIRNLKLFLNYVPNTSLQDGVKKLINRKLFI